jgi:hypothetical protein
VGSFIIWSKGGDSAGAGKAGNEGIKQAAPYHTGREVWLLVSLDKKILKNSSFLAVSCAFC